MATDVSSFKDAYKKAIESNFPKTASLTLGDQTYNFEAVDFKLRYGTNPHQPFAAYRPIGRPLSIGAIEMLKGGKEGLSLTNVQDMSQALNILKYFDRRSCVSMKHINPCGFKEGIAGETTEEIYLDSRKGDDRSHFGSVVGFNYTVDGSMAKSIMESFVECVIAPSYTDNSLEILRRNEGTKKLNNAIRVARVANLDKIPKFVGDDVTGLYNIRNLADGTLTFETPYLTRIRSVTDFVTDPMIVTSDGKEHIATTPVTTGLIDDCLTAWYLNINTRSNGIVFVKDGMALTIETGQQERVGAVERGIQKAIQKGHDLEGAVMSSDGFFPQRDSIDAAAAAGIKGIVWPAGSQNDSFVIDAANEHGIALLATLERCFLHI